MVEKQTVAMIGLTAIILIFTGGAVGNTPASPILGVVAPMIIPALLTSFLLMILAYGRQLIEILGAVLMARPIQQGRRPVSLLGTIIAWAVIIALAAVVLRPEFARILASALQQAAEVFSSTLNVFRQPTQDVGQPSASASNVFLSYYTIAVFGAIVIVSFSLLLGAIRMVYTEIRAAPGNPAFRENVLNVIQDARDKLEAHERYHETILECYRQMCETLSVKGHNIQPEQTAREFAENLSGKLDLGTDSVKGLTFLFEEARYSDHEIGDEKRGLAVNYLSSLENALAGVGVRI